MVKGSWFRVTYGSWLMVHGNTGSWQLMVHGSRFMVHGSWFMVNDSRFMIIHYGREEKLL